MKFKQFLGSSIEPDISDAEIVVCFVDVRGFTAYCRKLQREMQDRKIQSFLKRYVRIFNEGLLQWFVSSSDEELQGSMSQFIEQQVRIRSVKDAIIPSSYKNLGDGLMIVWEIPSAFDDTLQGILTQQIMTVIHNIIKRFYFHFRELLPTQ